MSENSASRRADPIGKALTDYLAGDHEARVLTWSDVEGWDVLEASRLCRPFAEMPELEQMALRNCSGRVLDIGAGAGSHSLWLQEQGHEVTAIDISPGSVQAMQQRGVRDARCVNIRNFHEGGYDTALMMMNGIGLCANIQGLKSFLRHMKSLLNPGGSIIFDSADLVYLIDDMAQAGGLERDKYYGEVLYRMKYGKEVTSPFGWLFIDFPTLSLTAAEAGWDAEMLYEGTYFEYLGRLRPVPESNDPEVI